MWKILHVKVPNVKVQFISESMLGIQAVVPSLNMISRPANYIVPYMINLSMLLDLLCGMLYQVSCRWLTENIYGEWYVYKKLTEMLNCLPDEPSVSGYARAHDDPCLVW